MDFHPNCCICCNSSLLVVAPSWELASSIKEAKERFDSAGVKLVAVGVGTPDKARILADRVCFLFPPLLVR